tara:strand:- start:2085 stop:2339 length:255 start_codon:yes stop_codon:yes gene_type:complete
MAMIIALVQWTFVLSIPIFILLNKTNTLILSEDEYIKFYLILICIVVVLSLFAPTSDEDDYYPEEYYENYYRDQQYQILEGLRY